MDTIAELIERVEAIRASDKNRRREELWKRHDDGEPVEKTPIALWYVPGSPLYLRIYEKLLGTSVHLDAIASATGEIPRPLAQEIVEFQLRIKLFFYENVPDDVHLNPGISTNLGLLWLKKGKSPLHRHTQYDPETGAWVVRPSIEREGDLDKLTFPNFYYNEELHKRRLAVFDEITGGKIPVSDDNLSMFVGTPSWETCRLRGPLQFLLDTKDRPAFVHQLMRFVTDAKLRYDRQKLEKASIKMVSGVGGDEVNCQMFSPETYDQFIFPYEYELAPHYERNYYHSCGNLTPILDRLLRLPNIHKIHISPWTDLRVASEKLGNRVVLQKIMDPRRDIGEETTDGMRAKLREIKAVTSGCRLELVAHCETAAEFGRCVEFVRVAQEELS